MIHSAGDYTAAAGSLAEIPPLGNPLALKITGICKYFYSIPQAQHPFKASE